MALVTCLECQATISDKAPACVKCGATRDAVQPTPSLTEIGLARPAAAPPPKAKSAHNLAWALGVGAVIALLYFGPPGSGGSSTPREPNKYELRRYIEFNLKESGSAEYRQERVHPVSKHLCGQVNAKNSFGGYTGFKRFVAGPVAVAIDGETAGFDKWWSVLCEDGAVAAPAIKAALEDGRKKAAEPQKRAAPLPPPGDLWADQPQEVRDIAAGLDAKKK